MISQVEEKKMHIVRWLLAVGWLTLIFSLLYDPISPWFTDPNNLSSPFRLNPEIYLDPEKCVKVQGVCLPEQPYGMGGRIFWAIVLPIGIMILLVLGHEVWRRICPLYFFSQIPRRLNKQRKVVVNASTGRKEVPAVDENSWLGRNYLYLQVGLFYLGLNIRILFVNGDRLAMFIFLMFTICSSIVVGYLFKGRSWCHYFCPMAPVQMFYTGPRGLLGTEAHLSPPQSITQSMCRTVVVDEKTKQQTEKSACVSCKSPCFDIDSERNYWQGITKPDQKLLFYTYFGLMLGFYCFYFLYAGSWQYYYSGAWTHEEGQLSTLFQPGFYISGQTIPIPKIIAAPLTLAVFAAASYYICLGLEKAFRAYLKQRNKNLSEEEILHVCFAFCTFVSFNVFFMFGGRPNISLLPNWAVLLLNGIIVVVSTLWLRRSLSRTPGRYSKETQANSLARQLNKLAIDFSKFLEGRSLKDLTPDEVYVLAKVLPGVSRTDRIKVYKGVLKESLEEGNAQSANSLEVLKDLRKELLVTDEEHFTVLKELGVENPEIVDPDMALTREKLLRIDGYRRDLELLLLDLVESGRSLQQAIESKQKQIMASRQKYSITPEEEERVLAELFNEDSALMRRAEAQLAQLQDLSVCYQALNRLAPNRSDHVYVLLRSSVQEKQQLITSQILGILEILGDSTAAMNIARNTGVLAANVVQEMLDDGQAKWRERLNPIILNLLRQAENLPTQPNLPRAQLGAADATTRLGAVQPQVHSPDAPTITEQPQTQASSSDAPTRLNPVQPQASSSDAPTRLNPVQPQVPSADAPTILGTPGDSPQPDLRPGAIVDVLLQLLQDLDPLVQAASLYALDQIDPNRSKEQASQLMNAKANLDWLVRETAENILARGNTPSAAANVPTIIAQVRAMGRTEQRNFQQPVIRLGRSYDNDIVIADTRVSREHAIFYLDERGVSIKDLDSANGLRIGSETIRNEQKQLSSGDIIKFSAGDDLLIIVNWEMRPGDLDMNTEAVGTLEKLLWLYESSFFQGIKANALIELAHKSKVRLYRPGEVICKMGDPSEELLVLIDGKADVSIMREGQAQVISTISPGQTIGEVGVLTHAARSATVIATAARTRAVAIDGKVFETVLSQDPLLSKNLLVLVSTRLQKQSQAIAAGKS